MVKLFYTDDWGQYIQIYHELRVVFFLKDGDASKTERFNGELQATEIAVELGYTLEVGYISSNYSY